MPTLGESFQSSQVHAALSQGLDVLSGQQTVTFYPYIRQTLPLDGWVFWVNANLLTGPQIALAGLSSPNPVSVPGSLHYASQGTQITEETIVVRRVDFAAEQPIGALAVIAPNVLWIGTWSTPMGAFKFSFSSRSTFYIESDISHYVGDAVYPVFESQIVDDPGKIVARQIVSNSLPIWLQMINNPPLPPILEWVPPEGFALYPEKLVPENLQPPYGAVEITNTHALQAFPTIGPRSEHSQLVAERVRLHLYGLNNDSALDFQDYFINYCTVTPYMGIMTMPVMVDEHRSQTELAVVAQKKIFEVEVDYLQRRARDLARQYISSVIVDIYDDP